MRSRIGTVLAGLAVAAAVILLVYALVPEVGPDSATRALPAPEATEAPLGPPRAAPPGVPAQTEIHEPPQAKESEFEALVDEDLERALPDLAARARDGDAAALDAILRGLFGRRAQLRERSIQALARVGDASVVPQLEAALRDPDPDVREALTKTLARLGGPEAERMLTELVFDSDPDVAEDAIQAMLARDYRSGNAAIRQVAANADPMLASKAAHALRLMGDEASAQSALKRMAQGLESANVMERRETVHWIREVGGRDALTYLHLALDDPDPVIQRAASRAIAGVTEELEDEG